MASQVSSEVFLSLFKELEGKITSLCPSLNGERISYSRALNEIYDLRLNPVINRWENYQLLKTAGDLRNILSHQNEVCLPTDVFFEKFKRVSDQILNPAIAYQASTKNIICCKMEDSIYEVMIRLDESNLSHLPILDKKRRVLGIFSRSSIFDKIVVDGFNPDMMKLKISDFRSVIGIEDHLNERFLFVKREANIIDLYPMLIKTAEHEKTISLILVTENGKRDESLLGVLTISDLTRSIIEKRAA